MTESPHDPTEAFADTVVENLRKHGFPDRKVAFPIERLYDSAYAKGVNFNKVLDVLAARGIDHEKTPERVVFEARSAAVPTEARTGAAGVPFPGLDERLLAGLDPAALDGKDPAALLAVAEQLLARLDPAQLEAMKAMVEGMSDDQKAALLARGRALGL